MDAAKFIQGIQACVYNEENEDNGKEILYLLISADQNSVSFLKTAL